MQKALAHCLVFIFFFAPPIQEKRGLRGADRGRCRRRARPRRGREHVEELEGVGGAGGAADEDPGPSTKVLFLLSTRKCFGIFTKRRKLA